MLQVRDGQIWENGRTIKLRGYCLGNFMMMENFMMGFPGVEQQFRSYLKEFAGEEKSSFFLKKLMDYYVEEDDIRYLKELGINVIRLPFNYRHFEEDERPFVYQEAGFFYMDKLVQLCKKYGIYVILDLHGAQGYQNEDWHCDNYERKIDLFENQEYQKRVAELWKYIAQHYRDEETVAAYDLLNEPVARGETQIKALNELYVQVVRAIRQVDQEHMIVLRGNYWGQSFDGFQEPFDDNLLYACHYYTKASLKQTPYPDMETGDEGPVTKEVIQANARLRASFAVSRNRPLWVSEFGLLDDHPAYHDSKIRALRDQLEIFNQEGYHWTVWSYKDVGNMGLVRPKRDTPWVKLTEDIIGLKKKYNCDYNTVCSERWPLSSIIKQYVGEDLGEYYEEARGLWERELTMIFNNILAKIFARKLAACSLEELDGLAASFRFRNCSRMTEWEELVREAAGRGSPETSSAGSRLCFYPFFRVRKIPTTAPIRTSGAALTNSHSKA